MILRNVKAGGKLAQINIRLKRYDSEEVKSSSHLIEEKRETWALTEGVAETRN